MRCLIVDMRCKEVINVCNGHRMGFVSDVQIDIVSGQVVALIVPGPCRFFGLFGREDDFIIPWEKISRIGEDIILVELEGENRRLRHEKRRWF